MENAKWLDVYPYIFQTEITRQSVVKPYAAIYKSNEKTLSAISNFQAIFRLKLVFQKLITDFQEASG